MMFFLLMLFGLACIAGYIVAGHNWNYTATQINDAVGDMDEYTVLLYEGTVVPETPTTTVTLADRINNKLNQWFNMETDTSATEEEVSAVEEPADVLVTPPYKGSDIQQAAAAYREKGAAVFVINTALPAYYEEGSVVKRGSVRVGILSVYTLKSLSFLQAQVDYLRSLNVDHMVVLTDNLIRIAGLRGVDVVIQASPQAPDDWDFASQGRYITVAPGVGSIAATSIKGSIISTRIL
ncbi:MAG: hypothetical protein Q4E12_04325 [Coriobacteriia bacterium]|nr:hypothetical protein [Coriobacteriia bacterium]